MKKKSSSLFLLSLLIFLGTAFIPSAKASYYSEHGPTYVYVDGVEPSFVNVPVIKSGTTMVEFRPIFEILGLTVGWDPELRKVTGKSNETTIEMSIGSKTAYVNGNKVALNIAPYVENGRTLVPLRFVAEASGKKVSWDGNTRMILINDGLPSKQNFKFSSTDLNSELLTDAAQGKLGPFEVSQIGSSMAEVINKYGFPDARHDGTPYSGDIPFIVYGDYYLYFMGNSYDEEFSYLNQPQIRSINVSLTESTQNRAIINAFGYPDEIVEGMYLTFDYHLGDYVLSVETQGTNYNSIAYAISLH